MGRWCNSAKQDKEIDEKVKTMSDGPAKPPAITTASLLLQHSPGRDLLGHMRKTVYGK